MRRFLTDWPASARAAAGVLSALVLVLAVTTVLSVRHHDRTRLTAAGPTTTTTTSPPDTAFLTTLPPATSTSLAKAAGPTTTTTTTSVSRGGVVATTSSTTSPRTTSTLAPTSTTVGPGNAYCRAAVTDARPPAGAKDTVNITSTLPGHDVTLVLHYRTSDVTFPAAGQPAFNTDATGKLSVTFDVSQGSKDYPVIVDVAVGGAAASCETNFRPTS